MILFSRTRNSSRDGLPGSRRTRRSGTSLPRPGRRRIRAPAAVTRRLTSAAAMTSAASVAGKTTARTITTAKISAAALTARRAWTPPVRPTRRVGGLAARTGLRPPPGRESDCVGAYALTTIAGGEPPVVPPIIMKPNAASAAAISTTERENASASEGFSWTRGWLNATGPERMSCTTAVPRQFPTVPPAGHLRGANSARR
jgi:hypothetical protein